MIYGTALLAGCYLVGMFLGELLGNCIGVKANVGGVGIAMLLLVLTYSWANRRGRDAALKGGIVFWGGMYIPVVVAMAMQLDVHKALAAGLVALLAATGTVLACGTLIAWINRREPEVDLHETTGDGSENHA